MVYCSELCTVIKKTCTLLEPYISFVNMYYLFWEMPVQIEIHQSETMGSKSENLDITLAHG